MRSINRRSRAGKLISKIKLSTGDSRDILSATLLFVLSFPPSPFGFLVYLAFIPQLALFHRNRPFDSFVKGYILGVLINSVSFYWLTDYSVLNTSLIIALNSIQYALFGAVFSHIVSLNRRLAIWLFPLIWTSLEYGRQFGDLAFNWLNIAWTQSYYTGLIQISAVTGYMGIVFWIALVNCLIWKMIHSAGTKNKRIIYSFVILSGFLSLYAYGWMALNDRPVMPGIRISCIQPNIAQELKWQPDFRDENFRRLVLMSNTIRSEAPALVIWPETALPYQVRSIKPGIAEVMDFADSSGLPVLFGGVDSRRINENTARYNAAFLVRPAAENGLAYYHKLKLVPIEEGIPFESFVSYLLPAHHLTEYLARGDSARLLPLPAKGQELLFDGSVWQPVPGQTGNYAVDPGVLICYESLFPQFSRDYARKGANLLTVLTNDAWFGYSAQPFQHLQIAVFRAIENRIPVVQCANSGISGMVDPWGLVHNRSRLFEEETLTYWVPLRTDLSLYTRFGDWFAILCFYIMIFSYIYIHVNKRFKQV